MASLEEQKMTNAGFERKKRIFQIIEVGNDLDEISRGYDFLNAFAIVLNLTVSIMYTFSDIRERFGAWLILIEQMTIVFFAVDYILRVWTAQFLYTDISEKRAVRKYIFSFTGIVDLLSFLPYYLPIFFPSGAVAFRMVRIVRIFRLFRINAYYDSLNVITDVIYGKKQQLFSSVFIILVLMLSSSLCMYSLEHEAQPEVFQNAFSGIWWAASTLLTVGYGDIYPVTTAGRVFGIFITFLGVGMVAIPTGIISAGFVDQYSSMKKKHEYGYEADVQFIKIHIRPNDSWAEKKIMELELPSGMIVAAVKRQNRILVPNGGMILKVDDRVILGAEPFDEKEQIHLKEIVLRKNNPWTGRRICDMDISRHSLIVLVKRGSKALIPNGDMVLKEGDRVFVYTQKYLPDEHEIEI